MIILSPNKKSIGIFSSTIIDFVFIFLAFLFGQNNPQVNYPPTFPDAQ